MNKFSFLIFLLSFLNSLNSNAINGIPCTYSLDGRVLFIYEHYNLEGKTLSMPENSTICFRGGRISNGAIVGNNTSITGITRSIFDNVEIKGTWNVKSISTRMFVSTEKENSLKQVFALTNETVNNEVYIAPGSYILNAKQNKQILTVKSNTKVTIDGAINLVPNDYTWYNMFYVSGDNITIKGKGLVCGDKQNHMGKDGQWGMGVAIYNGHNILMSGITIKDCWGDCIYIGQNSTDITIKKCNLISGRRQGISITSAKNVLIEKSTIQDVSGCDPQFAIDLEPNKNDTVENITIKKVKSIDCYGGFKIAGREPGAYVGEVTIINSSISGASARYPLELIRANTVLIKKNKITLLDKQVNLVEEISDFTAESNTVSSDLDTPYRVITTKSKEIHDKKVRR